MPKKCSFMYDDFSDRLLISCKKPSDKVQGSVRFLNLVIDLGSANNVVNIELRKASDFLKSLKINPKILSELINVDLVFKQCREGYIIYFVFETSSGIERVPYNIQSVQTPIINY